VISRRLCAGQPPLIERWRIGPLIVPPRPISSNYAKTKCLKYGLSLPAGRTTSGATDNDGLLAVKARVTRRETMKTMMIAAVVAAGLGIAPAFADNASGYLYPDFWGDNAAQQQVPAAQAPAHSSSGASVGAYFTQSNHGTWLFPPHDGGGANS
jgi:hypothetical protein